MERWALKIAPSSIVTATHSPVSEEVNAVLRELVELLEDYAPIWYTEDLHNRASAALSDFQPAV
jgi:hypothetical protein